MPVSSSPLFGNLSMKSTIFFMACQSLSLPSTPSLILVRLVQFLNLPVCLCGPSKRMQQTNTHRHTTLRLYFHPPTVYDTKKAGEGGIHFSKARHQSIVGHDSSLLGGRLFMVSVFKSIRAVGEQPVSLCY